MCIYQNHHCHIITVSELLLPLQNYTFIGVLRFNGHFPGVPRSASIYWGGDNWTTGAISRAKLQSDHHQQTNINFLQAGCPSWRPNNNVKALKGKISFHGLAYPKLTCGVFQLCLWPLIAPGYLGGGLPCLSSALWCQLVGLFIYRITQKPLGWFSQKSVEIWCMGHRRNH